MANNSSAMFFEKNQIDLDLAQLNTGFDPVTITITDGVATDTGQSFVSNMRDRSNESGWGTTGSTDAAGTIVDVVTTDQYDVDSLFLLGINFKSFTVKYYDTSSVLQDFSTAIAPTTNTKTDLYYLFTKVTLTGIRITINSCMVTDDDKICAQIILTRLIGQLGIQPIVQPLIGKNRQVVSMISGKARVQQNAGAVSVNLQQNNLTDGSDIALIQSLYRYIYGFLVWLNANHSEQSLPYSTEGFRTKDVYLMNMANDFRPEPENGFYYQGMPLDVQMVEVG